MKIFVNLITIFRLTFTIILASIRGKISKVSFVVAVALLFSSDYIDGLLARKFKVQTFFGSIMDTIADKVLSIVLYIFLTDEQPILIPILICEVIIAIINIAAIIIKKHPKSNKIGKTKMWFVGINIILGYLYCFNIIPYALLILSAILAFGLEIATIISYSISLFKKSDKPVVKHKLENVKDLKYVLFNTEYYLSTL